MNVEINKLVKSLLDKDSLEQCSLQELEHFADRHPYFGAAQLLLTKKLQKENPERYNEQLQKTFLFFHNPLWVEHLMNETGNAQIAAPEKKEVQLEETIIEEEVITEKQIEIPAQTSIEPVEITSLQEEPVNELKTEFDNSFSEPPINIPALKMESIDPIKAELVFEPFHTVDYFASQGIKFKEEEKPTDKFGLQLKSFTDWLKTMKRLPIADITSTEETNTGNSNKGDVKVEEMAEHSLTERIVLTEAMAEVWEKQGNLTKAIEVYNKLSLLDPSKSPYFAAKIEGLKKKNQA
jgi:hypothetical protein